MKSIVLRSIPALVFLCCLAFAAAAQTLFSYGDQSVSRDEFLKAYRKNNSKSRPTEKSYRDYLDLYMRYKLKVKAAHDLRLDTLSSQKVELQNFRNQIVEQYMHDEASVNRLVNEAFARSQKDIHIAQIYISASATALPEDTLKAYKKAREAYAALKSGKPFGEVAAEYSDDPFAKTNKGDLGYITVFDLPYDLETLAYSIAPGKISAIYRSKSGYHIFKNIGERKAFGKMKAAQILMLFPYHPSDAAKAEVKQRADSIRAELMKGSDFSALAKKFSGDNLSYQSGGEMPEFGIGRYDQAFETAAFALKKDGDISEPVATSFGYHIIKRLSRSPVSAVKDKKTMDALRQQVMSDRRIAVSRKEMLQTILKQTHYRSNPVNEAHLRILTDSSLRNRSLPVFPDLSTGTVLFSLDGKNITVKDWIDYRRGNVSPNAMAPVKPEQEWYDQFLQSTAFEHYRNNLEKYNKDFAYQLNEFRDGNLLFDIMQRMVWDKAATDSAGLKNYYLAHENKYWWQPSADAIIFTCSDERTARSLTGKLPTELSRWRRLVDSTNGLAQADSGRFELAQLPPAEDRTLQEGQPSAFSKNPTDNSVTVAFIIRLHRDRMPRSYNDARGLVINDYQAYLEDQWIAELKKKYPVKVNEAVLKSLPK